MISQLLRSMPRRVCMRPQGGLEVVRMFGNSTLKTGGQTNLDMYLRENMADLNKDIHPKARERRAQVTQALEPLLYKLHEKPENIDFYEKLGVN